MTDQDRRHVTDLLAAQEALHYLSWRGVGVTADRAR